MKNQIKNLPDSKVEIEFEIPAEELDGFFEKALLNFAKNLEIKGFRKGQAPKDVVQNHVGQNALMAEAAELAINDNYKKVLIENKIGAIGHPDVQIIKLAKGNPFIFKVVAQILPKVELPDYRKIAESVKREEVKVEEKEIQETLNWIQKSRAKNTLKNGAAEKGDFAEVEYQIISPEIPEFNIGNPQKDAFTLGEGHFLPGFEEAILGMKAGEEKENVELQAPLDFPQKEIAGPPASLGEAFRAGKTIKVKIKVKSVQTVELPEINDKLAEGAGKFDNLEALKKNISEGIRMEKEEAAIQRANAEILEKISKEAKVAIPKILVEQEKNRMLEGLKHEVAERLKISLDQYLARIKKTQKEIEDSFEKESEGTVKNFLIMKEIGEKENVQISAQEIENEINKFLSRYGDAKQSEKEIDLPSLRSYMEESIKNRKIAEILLNLTKK